MPSPINFGSVKVFSSLPLPQPLICPVITIGTFDGVHQGHVKILERVKQRASQLGGQSVVMTFDPHPRQVLFPYDENLRLLNTLDEKIGNLEKAGIDTVVVKTFNKEFSRLTALEFVRDILVNQLGVKELIIGYDHHFGRNREGSIENLREMAVTYGFTVEEIPARLIDEVTVSSTKIRNAILEGDMVTANAYLGYVFSFTGKVVHGDKRGRTIGFPTANLKLNDPYKILPGTGIYAVKVVIKDITYNAVMSLGYNPTVSDAGELRIEVHIFDLDADLYDQDMTVKVVGRIRGEQKFDSLVELTEQIKLDVIASKKMLQHPQNA